MITAINALQTNGQTDDGRTTCSDHKRDVLIWHVALEANVSITVYLHVTYDVQNV